MAETEGLSPVHEVSVEKAPSLTRSASAASIQVSKNSRSWLLGIAGGLLAFAGTAVDIATTGMVSKEGGTVMVSALAATRSSIGWVGSLFSFLFLGGIALIGYAMGENDPIKAGRVTRLLIAIAFGAGLVGTLVLLPTGSYILDIFGQDDVTDEGLGLFQIFAATFFIDTTNKAIGGIMLGLMFVHVLVGIAILNSAIVIALVFLLFLQTELGLKAFGIAGVCGELLFLALSVIFLGQASRRKRYGLRFSLSDITKEDVRDCIANTGLLSIRSLIVETPYFVSMILSIRMSAVHGTVFQFLYLQSKLVDNIVGGFAMAMNFMGARLWGGGYHGAFWIILLWFLICMCTPLVVIFASIAISKGRGSLASDFGNDEDVAELDALMSTETFVIYILILLARGYYNMLDQALIASKQLGKLAIIVSISCAAFLACALAGDSSDNFTVLYLGTLVFYICRIIGDASVLWQLGREHGLEKFERNTRSDPEYALKLTITDPTAAQVFGGKVIKDPDSAAKPSTETSGAAVV